MISHIFLCVTSPQQFFLFVVVVVCEVRLIFFTPVGHILTEAKKKKKEEERKRCRAPTVLSASVYQPEKMQQTA